MSDANNRKKEWTKEYLKTERGKAVYSAASRRFVWKAKMACLATYGGNPPRCSCCGETNLGFLTIDHVNNDGSKHLKSFKGSIFLWLKKNNFPSGFQVLCFNCNCGREHNNGVCPHIQQINPLEPRRKHREKISPIEI